MTAGATALPSTPARETCLSPPQTPVLVLASPAERQALGVPGRTPLRRPGSSPCASLASPAALAW